MEWPEINIASFCCIIHFYSYVVIQQLGEFWTKFECNYGWCIKHTMTFLDMFPWYEGSLFCVVVGNTHKHTGHCRFVVACMSLLHAACVLLLHACYFLIHIVTTRVLLLHECYCCMRVIAVIIACALLHVCWCYMHVAACVLSMHTGYNCKTKNWKFSKGE